MANARAFLKLSSAVLLATGMTMVGGLTHAVAQQADARAKIEVGSVNGTIVYLDEVMQVAESLPEEYRRQPLENYYDNLVDEVFNTRLAAEAARQTGLNEDALVNEAIRIATDRILAEAYFAIEMRKAVTDDEIAKAYERIIADQDSREEVSARHILVETEAEAIGLIDKLKDGADFAELAKEFSTGPSGPNGGDLGYFGRGQMVPDFEVAAFNLAIGTFSAEPVQTQFGWHVIKLEDKRTAPPASLDELRPQIANGLSQQTIARMIEELRSSATLSARSFADVKADAQAAQQQ